MKNKDFLSLNVAHHKVLLWILAFIITVASAYYQKITGPTHSFRGSVNFHEQKISYKLIRSETVGRKAEIAISVPDTSMGGFIKYKRYKSNDEWTLLQLIREKQELKTNLPSQPPAGKLIYYLTLQKGETQQSLTEGKPVIIRYKGSVPVWILIPHILLIFMAMFFSNRAGMEALDRNGNSYKLMIWTIVIFFISGFILGPLMQKFAFGSLWTGIPFGKDLTDNKTLFAMIGWLIAWYMNCKGRHSRGWIVFAAVLMLAVYLIPHSLLGSELDYTKISPN